MIKRIAFETYLSMVGHQPTYSPKLHSPTIPYFPFNIAPEPVFIRSLTANFIKIPSPNRMSFVHRILTHIPLLIIP